MKMADDSSYVLSWDLHEPDRTSTLKFIWESDDFVDVTIACDDDQIEAHKVILSAASPFFHDILKRNPHSHPLLYLKGTAKKDMKLLLDFIYSGETKVPKDQLEDFMTMAISLKVKGLVDVQNYELDDEVANMEDDECLTSSEKTKIECIKTETIKAESKEEPLKNVTVVHILEKASDIESYSQSTMEKYVDEESSVIDDSFRSINTLAPSFTEYEQKVLELVGQSESSWICTVCQFSGKVKSHVREHVQEHINGYSFKCDYCDKTLSMKRTYRKHMRKCKASH